MAIAVTPTLQIAQRIAQAFLDKISNLIFLAIPPAYLASDFPSLRHRFWRRLIFSVHLSALAQYLNESLAHESRQMLARYDL